MKKKLYLVRHADGFRLAKGEDFIFCEGLALVREFEDEHDKKPSGLYAIIDIASGLNVSFDKSKKKLLERWEQRKEGWIPAIASSRKKTSYPQRVNEMAIARTIWRNENYEV